ncbi:MAG: PEP-CTERM sorting domain-containing protein [Deferribacteres bacterium]|nr:PEP-CTERM sorting domain-containing protein [Deferribacteres bacterium]
MKKALFLFTAAALLVLFGTTGSRALTIVFDPVSQDVMAGDPVDVALVISGLGDYTADSLSTFDLDIVFDPAILGFNSVSYGDPVLGDQLDIWGLGTITTTTPGAGFVNLYELSLDLPSDVDAYQAGSFTLATLSFDTLSPGMSYLDISVNALGDAWGDPLTVSTQGGIVNVVPEPATLVLLGGGLAGLGLMRRFCG